MTKSAYTASRFGAAFLMLLYGFAKLNGSQFTIFDSELDRRSRARLCVSKFRDGRYGGHRFEVDEAERKVSIWQHRHQRQNQIFDGSYELSGRQLRLSGRFMNHAEAASLLLRRRE